MVDPNLLGGDALLRVMPHSFLWIRVGLSRGLVTPPPFGSLATSPTVRPLDFAPPPHDGFAFLAAPERSREGTSLLTHRQVALPPDELVLELFWEALRTWLRPGPMEPGDPGGERRANGYYVMVVVSKS